MRPTAASATASARGCAVAPPVVRRVPHERAEPNPGVPRSEAGARGGPMSRALDFGPALQVLIHDVGADAGIAEVVFGPEGSMPTTDARTHADVATLWSRLAREPGVRSILVRSVGKGFCAGGHMDLVADLMASESTRLRVMREARDIVQGMIDCDVPIVSAIHGAAVGAGAA